MNKLLSMTTIALSLVSFSSWASQTDADEQLARILQEQLDIEVACEASTKDIKKSGISKKKSGIRRKASKQIDLTDLRVHDFSAAEAAAIAAAAEVEAQRRNAVRDTSTPAAAAAAVVGKDSDDEDADGNY